MSGYLRDRRLVRFVLNTWPRREMREFVDAMCGRFDFDDEDRTDRQLEMLADVTTDLVSLRSFCASHQRMIGWLAMEWIRPSPGAVRGRRRREWWQ